MDGKGRALDNIFVERLWRTVKYEEVYLRDYASPREARQGLSAYFLFYNEDPTAPSPRLSDARRGLFRAAVAASTAMRPAE